MEDFYLTLPSNVFGFPSEPFLGSHGQTPGNKTNNYRTKLPENIKLDGEWEMALVEMQYPMTWDNIDDKVEKAELLRNHKFYCAL